jgi:predicted nucleic acid-binding Zn ribbon protein
MAPIEWDAHHPRRLGEILDRTLRRMGAPDADVLSAVFGDWDEIAGSEVAAHTRPRAITDGCLVVVADDAAWASRVRWSSAVILEQVATRTGAVDVTEMRVRVGAPRPGEGP